MSLAFLIKLEKKVLDTHRRNDRVTVNHKCSVQYSIIDIKHYKRSKKMKRGEIITFDILRNGNKLWSVTMIYYTLRKDHTKHCSIQNHISNSSPVQYDLMIITVWKLSIFKFSYFPSHLHFLWYSILLLEWVYFFVIYCADVSIRNILLECTHGHWYIKTDY